MGGIDAKRGGKGEGVGVLELGFVGTWKGEIGAKRRGGFKLAPGREGEGEGEGGRGSWGWDYLCHRYHTLGHGFDVLSC